MNLTPAQWTKKRNAYNRKVLRLKTRLLYLSQHLDTPQERRAYSY